MTMSQFSVIEIADLYGMNRQTVYKRINKGELSKNSDGKIDLAEAIRVFGEPPKPKQSQNESGQHESGENIELLKFKLQALEKQLRLSNETIEELKEDKAFFKNQIETMQRLLEAPKTTIEPIEAEDVHTQANNQNTAENSDSVANHDHKTESSAVAETIEEKEPQKKKGFWSIFG